MPNSAFNFSNLVYIYLAYVVSTSVVQPLVRRYIAQQEVVGVWQPTNIPLVDDWIARTSAAATAKVLADLAAAAASVEVSTTLQAVSDAVQTVSLP